MEDLSPCKIGAYLEGKSAIVTGGSIGIGAAIALKLAECGANVAINYRKHKEEAEAIINKITPAKRVTRSSSLFDFNTFPRVLKDCE